MQKTPDWLIDCTPREVQLEALRRSYFGLATKDGHDGTPKPRKLPHYGGGPARGWGHFLDMRLGKTATSLAEYMLLKRDHGIRRMFVFSPNSFKGGWMAECHSKGVDVPVHIFESKRRKDAWEFIDENDEGVLIVNYEILGSQTDHEKFVKWATGALTVADESVKIKGNASGFFKAAYKLGAVSAYTRALTGLPNPQGPHDFWSQLKFIKQIPGLNYYAFRARHCETGGFRGKQIIGIKNERRLVETLDGCSFIAHRKEWGGYTEADYSIERLEMNKAQRKAYADMEQEFVTWLSDTEAVTADQVTTKYLKLQQISSGFIIDEDKVAHSLCPFEKTAKYERLIEMLEEEINGKTIIIAKHTRTMDELTRTLAKYKPAVIRSADRLRAMGTDVDAEKARFNSDPECRVVIGQETATKYGHLLMGNDEHPCSTMVFYENSYSLDDRSQVEERPQGFGQYGSTAIIDFCSSPVERGIIEALQRKKSVADAILRYYQSAEGAE